MRVANLQRYLRSLVEPLTASGAVKKVIDDLEKTCQALEPFKESDFEQFAAYVSAAEEYRRTGVLPFPLPKPKKPATPRTPKKPKLDDAAIRELVEQVRNLQERALLAETAREELDTGLAGLPLDKLDKNGALSVAREVGVAVKAKTTQKEAVEGIRKSVLTRKEAVESLKV